MYNHLRTFRYRADIDGLRAVAVLGVVLFHAGLGVSGGFVGVDVFFVISGFLITSLILRDLSRGDFSIVNFWERRARRIFPALAVVVIVTFIAGWFLMLPFGYQVLGQSVVALTVFASNIQFWRTSGYFDPASEENPLLHTWSLSVEEQFYLIVPLLLLLIFSLGRQKWVGILLGAGILISLAGSELWLKRDPNGAFYLLPSRAWELGVGSLMALARPLGKAGLRILFSWTGLALITYSFFAYDVTTAFPGVAAIPPVLGTALLIWSGICRDEETKFSGANRLLATRGLVAIGLVSYSLYLWHWPFFAFHRYLFSHSPEIPLAIGYIVLALILSVLSLRFVEQPFRKRNLVSSRKSVFVLTLAISALIMVLGLNLWKTRGMPSRMPPNIVNYDAVEGDKPFPKSPITGHNANYFTLLGDRDKPCRVLIWGDSHANVLLHLISRLCSEKQQSGIAVTRGGVAPVMNWSGHEASSGLHAVNVSHNNSVMGCIQKLSQSGELKHVILAFRWGYYLDTPCRRAGDPDPVDGFADALITTIQSLKELGVEVSVLLEVPVFEMHVPKAVALHHWRGWPLPQLTKEQHLERQRAYAPLINRLRDETPNAHILDASPFLLSEEGEVEFLSEENILLYRDEHHLTKTGTMRLKPLFEKLFLN